VLSNSGFTTAENMFPCSVCQKLFKNWFQLRAHTLTCFSDTLSQSATLPENAILVPSAPTIFTNSHPQSNNDSFVDDLCDVDTVDTSATISGSPMSELLPLVFDWRRAPPEIDAENESTPKPFDLKSFNYHEVLIARDVRRHENALQWTNKNYSILSQVVNSLSLSQSDTDRLLNAVITTPALSILFHTFRDLDSGARFIGYNA